MEGCFPLGEHSGVYQAETVAVLRAGTSETRYTPPGDKVNFYVDSLSTIMSMTSHWPQPGLVRECHSALNELEEKMKVTLNWIPAHCGYSGNERTDVLAKKATQMSFTGPEPIIPISTQVPDHAIDVRSRKEHITKCHALESCGESKRILKGPTKPNGAYCRRLSRNQLRILTQVVTGHIILAVSDSFCHLCMEEEEDRDHFLCRCETLARVRKRVLGSHPMDPEELANIPLSTILEFVEKSVRFSRSKEGGQNSSN